MFRTTHLFLLLTVISSISVPESAFAGGSSSVQSGTAEEGVELLARRKKSADEDEDTGSRGIVDYLKMAFTGGETADEVSDGLVMEWIMDGMLASLGGHWWGPRVAYKKAPPAPGAATAVGVISTIMPWATLVILPFVIFWMIPYVGWTVGSVLLILVGIPWLAYVIFNLVMQWFVFPRMLQFIYSDAYAADGGGGSSRKNSARSKKDADEEEEEEEDEEQEE